MYFTNFYKFYYMIPLIYGENIKLFRAYINVSLLVFIVFVACLFS